MTGLYSPSGKEIQFDFGFDFVLTGKGFDLDSGIRLAFDLCFDFASDFGVDFHSFQRFRVALLFLLFLLLMSYSSRPQLVRTYSFVCYLPRNSAEDWPQLCVHPPQICGHPVEISSLL